MEASARGKAILAWWAHQIGDRHSARARAQAARLNRAGTLEVLTEPAVHDLSRVLSLRDPERLVELVQVLSAVREHRGETLARRLGAGESPVFSPSRFQRLIRSERQAVVGGLRRAIPMVDRACNVAALGCDLLDWDEATLARWCFHYFGQPAPERVSRETVSEETEA
jgi:CRISPR system Cascade subunit CasB